METLKDEAQKQTQRKEHSKEEMTLKRKISCTEKQESEESRHLIV